jgi:hypothetical protein
MKLHCMIAAVVFIGAECCALFTHSWLPFLLVALPAAGTLLSLSTLDRLTRTRNRRVRRADRPFGHLGRGLMRRVTRWFAYRD